MNNLVLVIIDDEPKAREVLKGYINILFPNNRFEIIFTETETCCAVKVVKFNYKKGCFKLMK